MKPLVLPSGEGLEEDLFQFQPKFPIPKTKKGIRKMSPSQGRDPFLKRRSHENKLFF
jgi:hypothetical protein